MKFIYREIFQGVVQAPNRPRFGSCRAVGKSRAMEMILTGSRFIDAEEAVSRGLASRVIPGGSEKLLEAAVDLAKQIAR